MTNANFIMWNAFLFRKVKCFLDGFTDFDFHSKRTPKLVFNIEYGLMQVKSIAECSLYADQKYCRILQGEHSAILSTFIKLPISIKTFVLPIFKRPHKTGFTVQ